MGIERQSLKNHLDRLRQNNLLKVTWRQAESGAYQENEYDLSPLMNRCDELARNRQHDTINDPPRHLVRS